jgi:hypothetical protein
MKPIHVYQCQDDCCLVQVPSKRFWYIDAPHALRDSAGSFKAAVERALELRETLPQEVTA